MRGDWFRLVTYGGGSPGASTLPGLYPTALEAVERAEQLLEDLEGRPFRRPYRVDIQDIWTRETVSRVSPDQDRDPDLCVTCGQPNDPFAGGRSSPFATADVPPSAPAAGGGPKPQLQQGPVADGGAPAGRRRPPEHYQQRLLARPGWRAE